MITDLTNDELAALAEDCRQVIYSTEDEERRAIAWASLMSIIAAMEAGK